MFIVNLTDENDNNPIFNQTDYSIEFREDLQDLERFNSTTSLLILQDFIQATDKDKSNELITMWVNFWTLKMVNIEHDTHLFALNN